MSDIVERLREYAKDWRTRAADASPCKEAADEIARLREALEQIRTELRGWGSGPAVDLAIDIASAVLAKGDGAMSDTLLQRLRQYEGTQSQTTACYNGLRDEAADEIDRLRDENDQLRDALAYIVDLDSRLSDLEDARAIAGRALLLAKEAGEMTLAGEVGKAMSVVLLGIADLQKELKEAHTEIDRLRTALKRIRSLAEKNVVKYAQQIADEALAKEEEEMSDLNTRIEINFSEARFAKHHMEAIWDAIRKLNLQDYRLKNVVIRVEKIPGGYRSFEIPKEAGV